MKCLFLYNPNSGRGDIKKKISYIRSQLKSAYDVVDIVATSSAEDLENRIRKNISRYDVILFSGGDGTFNNVLQAVGERDVQLGYIPSGTVNDVARSLGIPRNIKGALNVILKGRSERLDCLRVNGKHYVMYVAAAGAFTSATYTTPQNEKRSLGFLAYAMHGLKNNLDFQVFPLEIEMDGRHIQSDSVLVLVLNGRSVARMPVNRASSMRDGVFELALIRQVKRPGTLRRIGAYFSLGAMFLFGVRVKKRDITFVQGRRVKIRTDASLVWDFDGEEGVRGNVEIELLPRHVKLFVPNKKKV